MSYPKAYKIYVCPVDGWEDGMYPVYSCENTDAFMQPGKCGDCGKDLVQIEASDTDFYLATYELWA